MRSITFEFDEKEKMMNPTILVVEDNEFNRDMLSRRLKRQGFLVMQAIDGQQAIDMTISFKPDLILLDMSLPLISGWDVAQQLKQSPETKQIPIIAITAHAMAGDKAKAIEAGCDDYDTKPIELPRLLQKIQRLL